MFGPVGSGKTFLLDLAYENCPVVEKKRMHFAVFMKQIHQTLHL
jgi:predicted ATPase